MKKNQEKEILGLVLLFFLCLSGCNPAGDNYFHVAHVYQAQGRYGRAYNAVRAALEINPHYPEAREKMDELRELLKVRPEVISSTVPEMLPPYTDLVMESYTRQLAEKIPEYEKLYGRLMLGYDRDQEPLPAKDLFPLTVVLEKDVVGIIFVNLEDYRRLLDGVSFLYKDYLSYQNPYMVSGILLGMRGYFQEALGEFKKALLLDPDNAKVLNNLGVTYFRMGELKQAVDHFLRTLKIEPGDTFARTNLGLSYIQSGQFDDAEKQLEQILTTEPGNLLANIFLGYLNYKQSNFSGSIRFYREALKVDPAFAQAYYGLGSVMVKKGDMNQAITYFEKALGLSPNYLDAYVSLGAAYAHNRMFSEAEAVLLQVLELESDYPSAYYNLACTYALQNKKRAAIYNLEKAMENGFRHRELLLKDEDLRNIRSEPLFHKLIKRYPA